jgi:DUF1365 family protein
MNYHYTWSFTEPSPNLPDSHLKVAMKNWEFTPSGEPGALAFQALLDLKPVPLTAANVIRTVLTHPLLTFRSIIAIYWQAFLIYLKGIPFVPHPKSERK